MHFSKDDFRDDPFEWEKDQSERKRDKKSKKPDKVKEKKDSDTKASKEKASFHFNTAKPA